MFISFFKKTVFLFIFTCSTALNAYAAPAPSEEQLRKALEQQAEAFNKIAPVQVDDYTTVDKLVLGDGLNITYYNTIHLTDAQFQQAFNIERQDILPRLVEATKTNTCANPQYVQLMGWGTVVEYIYNDPAGEALATLKLDKDSCTATE